MGVAHRPVRYGCGLFGFSVDMELKSAYELFKENNEIEKAFACVRYLYKDGDYNTVLDFRNFLNSKKASEKILKFAKESYLLTAPKNFDDYLVAMEWERPYNQKFYLPRRKQLLPIVQEMQRLADDELDILGISAPPGIGKTGLGDFYMTFTAGRQPDEGMLMGSHSNAILADNYNECLRMCSTDDYCWSEIFPDHRVVRTNAADLKIDIDKPKKFSNFQFASIGSSLAGKNRAVALLYMDDIVPNIEVALSRDRLDKVWTQFTSDFLQRTQGNCKILMIMTRWSVHDPMGRLERMHEGNDRAKFLSFPALNENDESNFDYGGSIGFTTQHYHAIRDAMDEITFRCLYMNQPIEREGLLFDSKELKYYFDLPAEEPDAVLAVVDTKDRGVDDCVMPVAYRYGENYYIEELMCDSSAPDVTIPRIVDLLINHKVKQCRFESNAAGGQIARDVEKRLKERNGITSISTKYSTANKETRIIVDSAWIKSHCLFKDKEVQTVEYKKAMNLLCGFSQVSKNKKDDVPDALSMLANFCQSFETNVITIRQRLF